MKIALLKLAPFIFSDLPRAVSTILGKGKILMPIGSFTWVISLEQRRSPFRT